MCPKSETAGVTTRQPADACLVYGICAVQNPEIAVVTFIYDGGEGSEAAVPVTQKILEYYFTTLCRAPQPPTEEVAQQP